MQTLAPDTSPLISVSLYIDSAKVQSKSQVSLFCNAAKCLCLLQHPLARREGTEREACCVYLPHFGFNLTEHSSSSPCLVLSELYLQRACLKSASQWHTFSWPVSDIPHECHLSLAKVKDAPLEYNRMDSGEADLKCSVLRYNVLQCSRNLGFVCLLVLSVFNFVTLCSTSYWLEKNSQISWKCMLLHQKVVAFHLYLLSYRVKIDVLQSTASKALLQSLLTAVYLACVFVWNCRPAISVCFESVYVKSWSLPVFLKHT